MKTSNVLSVTSIVLGVIGLIVDTKLRDQEREEDKKELKKELLEELKKELEV